MIAERAQREKREQAEAALLAPCAMTNATSRGRRYPEQPHDFRLAFERDRDRVLHSRCFRRLEYKTQVFVNGTDDHYRTRMTHTIEMAAVCRTLARFFQVNEDLTETIALAHDVGHTPFGHCGERELDALMKDHGGFDHNQQSLRWVEFLEEQYPDMPGLNLTWEVRAGLLKHEAAKPGAALDGVPIGPFQCLEAQIADLADDMTYYAHDVDDALEAGVLEVGDLSAQPLWLRAAEATRAVYPSLDPEQFTRITVRNLLNIMVADVMRTASDRLTALAPASPADVMSAPRRMMTFGEELRPEVKQLHDFLYAEFYFTPRVRDPSREAVSAMRDLFLAYAEHPDEMGRKARRRIDGEGLHRTVCDYLSGFTDRYAFEEHARLKPR